MRCFVALFVGLRALCVSIMTLKPSLPFARIDIVIGRPDIYTRDETDHALNSLTVP